MQTEIDSFNTSVHIAAAFRSFKQGTIIAGATSAELVANAKSLLTKGYPTRTIRGVDALLIEVCACADSELTRQVPYGSAAFRITDKKTKPNHAPSTRS